MGVRVPAPPEKREGRRSRVAARAQMSPARRGKCRWGFNPDDTVAQRETPL